MSRRRVESTNGVGERALHHEQCKDHSMRSVWMSHSTALRFITQEKQDPILARRSNFNSTMMFCWPVHD
eukprot:3223003-Amphidinium_carterae.2